MKPSSEQNPAPLPGCTRRAIFVWGTIVAPVAAGFALGVAVFVGGEVLSGAFGLPQAADPGLASLFVLALIALLLSGFCSCFRLGGEKRENRVLS
ncbi:hypothetical protein ACFLT5_01960 [Chloroflexota bacterium]